LNRIAALDPTKPSPDKQEEDKVWTDLVRSSPSADLYNRDLVVRLQETGCDADLGPYVIAGFLLNPTTLRFLKGSPEWATLADAFLDEAHCPAARALPREVRISLQVTRKVFYAGPLSTVPHPSALIQTSDTGHRSSLARMASADLVQTNGLGLALCSAR
jgi:hypothetical protein